MNQKNTMTEKKGRFAWLDEPIDRIFKLSDDGDTSYAAHVRIFGFLYFSELFLMWIISGSTPVYSDIELWGGQKLMFWQSVSFLLGGFVFGWAAEKKNKYILLLSSIILYVLASVATLFFVAYPELDSSHWGFSISRIVTCVGLAGGIGINLMTVAFKKDIEAEFRSRGIAIFSFFGAFGTVLSSCILYCFDKWGMAVVLSIGIVLGVCSLWVLKSKKSAINLKSNSRFKVLKWSWKSAIKAGQIALLGLPTFYITSLLATNSNLLTDRLAMDPSKNLSALCLSWEYTGMGVAYLIICLWASKKWLKGNKTLNKWFGDDPVFMNRKSLLIFGMLMQLLFVVILFFTNISGPFFWVFMFIGSVGVGNWAIVLMLITEQSEFKSARYFVACLLPNLIRFGLGLLLFFQDGIVRSFSKNLNHDDCPIPIQVTSMTTADDKWLGLFLISWVLYMLIFLAFIGFKETGDQILNSSKPADPDIPTIFSEKLFTFFRGVKRDVVKIEGEDIKKTQDFLETKLIKLRKLLSESLNTKEKISGINFYYQVLNSDLGTTIFESGFGDDAICKSARIKSFSESIGIDTIRRNSLVKIALEKDKEYALIYKLASAKKNIELTHLEDDCLYWNLNDKNLDKFFQDHYIIDEQEKSSLNVNRTHHLTVFKSEQDENYFSYYIRPNSALENFDIGVLIVLYEQLSWEFINALKIVLDFLILNISVKQLGGKVHSLNDLNQYETLIKTKFNKLEIEKLAKNLYYFSQIDADMEKIKKRLRDLSPSLCLQELELHADTLISKEADEIRKETSIIKAWLKDLNHKISANIISYDDQTKEMNRIRRAIMGIIDQL